MKATIYAILAIFTYFFPGGAFADQGTIPHTFNSGQPALASEVNANFTASKNAIDDNYARLPMVWASTTEGYNNIMIDPYVSPIENNTLSVTAPSDGVLTISGLHNIKLIGPSFTDAFLKPMVDGGVVAGGGIGLPPVGYWESLNYTVTVPITAGPHTVSQKFILGGPVPVEISARHLTVTFFPAAQSNYNVAP